MPDDAPADVVSRALGPADMTGTWLVALVMLHREKRVASVLGAQQGVGWYLPQYRERRVYQKVARERLVPLYPRYLFVCCADDDARYAALSIKRRLRRIFYNLKEVNNQVRLVRQLATVHTATLRGEIKPYRLPVVGQRCRIVRGAYEGTEGKVVRAGDCPKFILQPEVGLASQLHVAPEDLEIMDA